MSLHELEIRKLKDDIKELKQENKHLTDLLNQALKDYETVLNKLESFNNGI